VTRPRLVVHAHLYQPSRADPWTGSIPEEPAATPYHDWNARIDAECYRPNVERGNFARMSFDVGPTLARWLEHEDWATYAGLLTSDRPVDPGAGDGLVGGNAMAQAYHHSILPLASVADRWTEIRWGLRDFELRFGRRATGIWLPETAVDLPTLRMLVAEGVEHTILAPWQAAETHLDTRRPYRVALDGGRSIVVVFYDGPLSAAVSFDPAMTADADRFVSEHVEPRLASASFVDGATPMAVIATDAELYGHHRVFRDLFLRRVVAPTEADTATRSFDVVDLATVLQEQADEPFRTTRIVERTSWSCHHGVARWTAECPDAQDGRWKGPLRAAFERLAAGIDATTITLLRGLTTVRESVADPDELLAEARDGYVDVLFGAVTPGAFAERWLAQAPLAGRPFTGPETADQDVLLGSLEAQRWRLAMFASDGWFWDDPARLETAQVLRAAARAVRIVDGLAGTHLEHRLVADLATLVSPSRHVDGGVLYGEALDAVGQPPVI
jgi:uncharacterized protein DUF3536/glycosyl hydrolase family 57